MSSLEKLRSSVILGKDPKIDENVVLGYVCGRSISDLTLVIGDNPTIRSGTVIYAGSKIGNNLETGHHVVIREENAVGDHFNIWSNSIVDYGCKIGNRVKIHCNCYIAQYTIIEDEAFLAPGVVTANDKYPSFEISRQLMRGPMIGKGVQVGINSMILPYVKIGEYSIIGAGSVVTRDIPPRSVAYGNPAKVMRSASEVDITKLRSFYSR